MSFCVPNSTLILTVHQIVCHLSSIFSMVVLIWIQCHVIFVRCMILHIFQTLLKNNIVWILYLYTTVGLVDILVEVSCPSFWDAINVRCHTCAMPSKSSSRKIITMPASLSSKVSLLNCQNPCCNRFNQKPFCNQTAYTNHIERSPGCFNFLVRQAQFAAPHGASVDHLSTLSTSGWKCCMHQ